MLLWKEKNIPSSTSHIRWHCKGHGVEKKRGTVIKNHVCLVFVTRSPSTHLKNLSLKKVSTLPSWSIRAGCKHRPKQSNNSWYVDKYLTNADELINVVFNWRTRTVHKPQKVNTTQMVWGPVAHEYKLKTTEKIFNTVLSYIFCISRRRCNFSKEKCLHRKFQNRCKALQRIAATGSLYFYINCTPQATD